MEDQPSISSAFVAHTPLKESSLPTSFGKCLRKALIEQDPLFQIRLPAPPPSMEPRGEILIEYAKKNLPQTGVLKVTEQGFIYLDLSDRYILDLFELLQRSDTFIPPYFDEENELCGAHISVALVDEHRKTLHLPEMGEEIPFTITGCYSVSPENWEEVSRVWFLTVEAPALSEVRKKLGLEPKIEGHEFHITFAIQKRLMNIDDLFLDRSSDDKNIIFGRGNVTQSRVRHLRDRQNLS